MRIYLIPCAVAFCAAASAQSVVTSPPGMTSREGNTVASRFANQANWRYMIIDGELLGTRRTLKAIRLRPDYADHFASYYVNTARRWTNVTIDLADGNAASVQRTYTSNFLSTPTRVFQAAVAWPALSGRPTRAPAPSSLGFPFARNWAYTGARDLCIDYQFHGGTITFQNQTYPLNGSTYALDAQDDRDGTRDAHELTTDQGCRDGFPSAAHITGGATSRDNGTAKTITFETSAIFTGRGNVFHAASLNGYPNGVPLPGLSCQRLYVRQPLVVGVAPVFGGPNVSSFRFGQIPFRSQYVGLRFYFQAAWTHGTTRTLQLTPGLVSTVVAPSRGPFRRSMVSGSRGSATASLVTKRVDYLPVHLFAY